MANLISLVARRTYSGTVLRPQLMIRRLWYKKERAGRNGKKYRGARWSGMKDLHARTFGLPLDEYVIITVHVRATGLYPHSRGIPLGYVLVLLYIMFLVLLQSPSHVITTHSGTHEPAKNL